MILVVILGVLVAATYYGFLNLDMEIEKVAEVEECNYLTVEVEVEEVTYFYVVLFVLYLGFSFSNKSP